MNLQPSGDKYHPSLTMGLKPNPPGIAAQEANS